jgi:hypothetical protein
MTTTTKLPPHHHYPSSPPYLHTNIPMPVHPHTTAITFAVVIVHAIALMQLHLSITLIQSSLQSPLHHFNQHHINSTCIITFTDTITPTHSHLHNCNHHHLLMFISLHAYNTLNCLCLCHRTQSPLTIHTCIITSPTCIVNTTHLHLHHCFHSMTLTYLCLHANTHMLTTQPPLHNHPHMIIITFTILIAHAIALMQSHLCNHIYTFTLAQFPLHNHHHTITTTALPPLCHHYSPIIT